MQSLRTYLDTFYQMMFRLLDLFIHKMFTMFYGQGYEKPPPISDMILLESAGEIAFKIRSKKITSVEVLESFIARIKEINPVLNCVVANRFEDALAEARAADELIASGSLSENDIEKEKPLLGVPFTTKDCVAVKDMLHAAGVVSRKYVKASEDAKSIALLRKAGAIPIALTNVSELCMWWESTNNLHGRTKNPYDTNRTVGGSSGGEGSIQAAAGSAFGIGTDIGGSIRIPSCFNGIFGHKPSPGVVSIHGQFPKTSFAEQETFLGIGPMCRRASDLLPILRVLTENSERLKLDEKIDIKNIDIFYQEDDMGSVAVSLVNPEIKKLFGKITTHFNKAHNKKISRLEIKSFSKSCPMWFACMTAPEGSSPTFEEQLTNMNGNINLPFEFFKWCLNLSEHTFIALVTTLIDRGGDKYGDPNHIELVKARDQLKKELLDTIGPNGVFIYPTHPTSAPYHNEPTFKPFNFAYTGIINVLGLPATHCPMGLNSEGLPIGVQVIAAPDNDRLCLAVAEELEKAFGGWVPPQSIK